MSAAPTGSVAFRAASTELPSFHCQTGRPVAKLRKCVPSAFGLPVVLYSVASGSVKSQVPFAWHVYFCSPVACAIRKSLLFGAYVRGSIASPGAVCGAGPADAAAASSAHAARAPAHAATKRATRACRCASCFIKKCQDAAEIGLNSPGTECGSSTLQAAETFHSERRDQGRYRPVRFIEQAVYYRLWRWRPE